MIDSIIKYRKFSGFLFFGLLLIICSCARAIAYSEEQNITIKHDDDFTLFTAAKDNCKVTIELYLISDLNRGSFIITRECDNFSINLMLIDQILSYIQDGDIDISYIHTLSWGGIDKSIGRELALFSAGSTCWEQISSSTPSYTHKYVIRTLKEINVYEKLKSIFRKHRMEIEETSVEKIEVDKRHKLLSFGVLTKDDVKNIIDKPDIRLPYGAILWFSLKHLGSISKGSMGSAPGVSPRNWRAFRILCQVSHSDVQYFI